MTQKTLTKCFTPLLIAIVAIGPLSGCASQTTITSTPPNAKLMIDGQPVGKTPYQYVESTTWLWSKHQVQANKRGYQPGYRMISASISPVHLIAGILCCLPLIAVGQYDPQYNIVLQRSGVGGQTVKEVWRASSEEKKTEVISINFSE